MANRKTTKSQKQPPPRKFPLKPAILIAAMALIVVAAITIFGKGAAPPLSASWYQTFGDVADESGYAVRQTPDGGFIITGETGSFGAGGTDLWLIKTDASGQLMWNKAYGGPGNEAGLALALLPDGYLVAGYTTSFGSGGQDAWLLRIDSEGALLWDKPFGGPGNDAVSAVAPAKNGGFVVAGVTSSSGSENSDGWLFKIDEAGNQAWSWTYGGAELDYLRTLNMTYDGGFIAVGSTDSFGSEGDVWLVKTDSGGNTAWQKRYRGLGNDFGVYTTQAADEGYFIAGTGQAEEGDSEYWLIRTDAAGDTAWSRTYGGDQDDVLEDAVATADGGVLFLGRTYSPTSGTDVWLIKVNGSGDRVWEEMVGGGGDDTGISVVEAAEGYVFTGRTLSYGAGAADVWLVKVIPE